jgi:hypothetical protein
VIHLVLRIDEIAAILVECIQDLEGGLFVAFAQSLLPGRAKLALSIKCNYAMNRRVQVILQS